MKKCFFCAEEIPDDSEYCPFCGEALDEKGRCKAMKIRENYNLLKNKQAICKVCNISLPSESKFCPKCGKKVQSSGIAVQPSKSEPIQEGSVIGRLMLIFGLLGAAYFFFIFDTSVKMPNAEILGHTIEGDRVNNIGLIADRQNGLILSLGVALIGVIMESFARFKK